MDHQSLRGGADSEKSKKAKGKIEEGPALGFWHFLAEEDVKKGYGVLRLWSGLSWRNDEEMPTSASITAVAGGS